MSARLTIIGLGQIGTSCGLALGKYGEMFRRTGFDIQPAAARQAKKMGALDQAAADLRAAVQAADIVLLAIPADQGKETMAAMAAELKAGAVILDTCPLRREINTQVHATLPEGRYYIGFTPMLSPDFLDKAHSGIHAADAGLFQRGLFAITAASDTAKEALQVAADMCNALGASPLFADEQEVDSLMAAVHTLPQLMAAALVNASMGSPGWQEGQKFAGQAYALASSPIEHQDGPEALASLAIGNRENVLRVLDALLLELQHIRGHIQQQNLMELGEQLRSARQARQQWWEERKAANWAGGQPPRLAGYQAGHNWFGGLFKGKKQGPGDKFDRS